MACQQTPTATLFGTSVISTFSVSTIVSTQLITVTPPIGDPIVTPTCYPTIVASSTSCVPAVITILPPTRPPLSVITSLITTVHTVPIVQTVTTPTQTLYTTSCGAQSPDEPVKNTATSTTTQVYVAPVTLTRTFSSTDPSGNIIVATVAIVSTPSPDSTQSGSGSGGPNTTAIIGGAVGGVVGLIALIGIIWFIMYKRRRGGDWDDTREEDQGYQAGAAEVKHGRPATADYGSSPNYGVVGSGIPSPLLRGDQPSGVQSHSRNTSAATSYATHGRSSSQTPFMLATSPPHSPPHSPPSLQQQPLPGAGAATPIWASPSAQQGYFYQGSPPIPSDPNFMPTVTSTYSAPSYTTSATASPTHVQYAVDPVVAYPLGGRGSTYNEYHKPPLEQAQHGAARQPSQHKQGSSGSTTKVVDALIDNSVMSELVAAGPTSVHKGGLNGAPKNPAGPSRVEEVPPAYEQ